MALHSRDHISRFGISVCLTLLLLAHLPAAAQSVDQGTADDILTTVATDVEKHYFDPKLKGLDWKKLTEEARAKLKTTNNFGEMMGIISGLVDQLDDSHTAFIPPYLSQTAEYGFKAKPIGGRILIYELTDDGPAAKAGLQLGDQVTAINGVDASRETFGKMMWYNTTLSPRVGMYISYFHDQMPEQTAKVMAKLEGKRLYADSHSVFRVADDQRMYSNFVGSLKLTHSEKGDGIVYIKLPKFIMPEGEFAELKRLAGHASKLILDLRDNPGGIEGTAADVAGIFLPAGTLVRNKGRDKTTDVAVHASHEPATAQLFVLIDGGSASAAEIVARALQLSKRATIIGDRSAGMVNAAEYIVEKNGAKLVMYYATQITVFELEMPDGGKLEKSGVTPDVMCIPTIEDLRAKKDVCLDKAVELAKRSAAQPAKQ